MSLGVGRLVQPAVRLLRRLDERRRRPPERLGSGGVHITLAMKEPSTPTSWSTAWRGPQAGETPRLAVRSIMAAVGWSQSFAAMPAVPLPANGSSIVSPGFVWVAMNEAIDSGEIFVGYEKALNSAPVRVAVSGVPYRDTTARSSGTTGA